MKLITRDTDYAIRAVCTIAKEKGRVVPVGALVEQLGIPRPFLRKLLQVLSRKKVLHSHKGAGGGFVLGKKPEHIYVVDLLRIFQGPFKLSECLLKKTPCPLKASCLLRGKIARIEHYVARQLESITIASLLK